MCLGSPTHSADNEAKRPMIPPTGTALLRNDLSTLLERLRHSGN
jgi:hypothetical protein